MAWTGADQALLDRLGQRTNAVLRLQETPKAVPYVASTWEAWLMDTPVADGLSAALEAIPPSSLTRNDLTQLAKAGLDDVPLFLATMIWGRGKSNGRMREAFIHTCSALDLAMVLERSGKAAEGGEPAEAYKLWTIRRGIRAPFFTKWLWIAGCRAQDSANRPLILDSRVWSSLAALGWDSRRSAGTSSWPDRYAAYVGDVGRWASQLSEVAGQVVSPQGLENTLFTAAGAFEKLDQM